MAMSKPVNMGDMLPNHDDPWLAVAAASDLVTVVECGGATSARRNAPSLKWDRRYKGLAFEDNGLSCKQASSSSMQPMQWNVDPAANRT